MSTAATLAAGVPETRDPLLVLERMDEGFYALDAQWRFEYVNASAEHFWGLERTAMLGRSILELFSKFAGSPAHAAHRTAMETGRPVQVEVTSTATGAPVELRLFPENGRLSVYFHDITPRKRLEAEIKAREELLSLAETSAGIGVWVADLATGMVTATPQFFRLLGLEPIDGPFSQELPRTMRHPEDRDRVHDGFREAMRTGAEFYDSEYRIIRPDGEQRWIWGRGRVVRDEQGRPWRYSGVDFDVTDRKKQEEHLRMVMRELLHRTNNLLAVVDGMARQTASHSKELADFMPTFTARLRGLGETSTLLARQEWRGAWLDELVTAQVAPFAEAGRFELSGPRVLLSPRAVQNLGLAVHELCTNAMKYGALHDPEGRVKVTWSIEPDGRLRLVWREIDGPPVKPPTRQGFGRVVSERMLAAALEAEVKTDFAASGIAWTAILPAAEFSMP